MKVGELKAAIANLPDEMEVTCEVTDSEGEMVQADLVSADVETRCDEIDRLYLWGSDLEDEEAMTPRSAVSLVEQQGMVLAVWNKKYNGFTLPGGKVEPGETPAQAHVRELMEEVGLTSIASECVYIAPSSGDPTRMVHVYREALTDGIAYAAEEGCPITWTTREELLASSPFREFYVHLFKAVKP